MGTSSSTSGPAHRALRPFGPPRADSQLPPARGRSKFANLTHIKRFSSPPGRGCFRPGEPQSQAMALSELRRRGAGRAPAGRGTRASGGPPGGLGIMPLPLSAPPGPSRPLSGRRRQARACREPGGRLARPRRPGSESPAHCPTGPRGRRSRRLADSDPGWRLGWHWRGATGRWCGRQPSVDNRRLSGQGTPAAGCCASPCRQPTAAGRGLWQLGGGVTVTAGVRVRGSGGGPGRPRLSNRGAPASPGPLRRGQGRPFCFEKQSSLRLIELIKAAPLARDR
jgi:hypothetical protein